MMETPTVYIGPECDDQATAEDRDTEIPRGTWGICEILGDVSRNLQLTGVKGQPKPGEN